MLASFFMLGIHFTTLDQLTDYKSSTPMMDAFWFLVMLVFRQLLSLVKERHEASARLRTLEDLMDALRRENEVLRQGLASSAPTQGDPKMIVSSGGRTRLNHFCILIFFLCNVITSFNKLTVLITDFCFVFVSKRMKKNYITNTFAPNNSWSLANLIYFYFLRFSSFFFLFPQLSLSSSFFWVESFFCA